MQSSASSVAQPEAILEWLQKEMGYRTLGPYSASNKAAMPSIDSVRKIFRGNMIPVWNFLLTRVKSEKTVENIRRNILVHGGGDSGSGSGSAVADPVKAGEVGRGRARKKEKLEAGGESSSSSSSSVASSREIAFQERDLAEEEVERLRHVVRRQRKELKARMLEVSREEAERKRMVDERSNYRLDL